MTNKERAENNENMVHFSPLVDEFDRKATLDEYRFPFFLDEERKAWRRERYRLDSAKLENLWQDTKEYPRYVGHDSYGKTLFDKGIVARIKIDDYAEKAAQEPSEENRAYCADQLQKYKGRLDFIVTLLAEEFPRYDGLPESIVDTANDQEILRMVNKRGWRDLFGQTNQALGGKSTSAAEQGSGKKVYPREREQDQNTCKERKDRRDDPRYNRLLGKGIQAFLNKGNKPSRFYLAQYDLAVELLAEEYTADYGFGRESDVAETKDDFRHYITVKGLTSVGYYTGFPLHEAMAEE